MMILKNFLINGWKLACLLAVAHGSSLVLGQGSPGGPGPPIYDCVTLAPYEGTTNYGWVPKVDGSSNPVYDTLKITIAAPPAASGLDPKTGAGGQSL